MRYFFFFVYEYLLRKEAAIFIKELKDYLFNHQLKIKFSTYKEKGIGKYLLRYSGDINSIKNLYIKGTIRVFIDLVMILIAFYWLYNLNKKGALAIFLLSLIFYYVLRLINFKVEHYSIAKRNKTSGQLSFVNRSLNSILNTIMLNKQSIELKKYKKKSKAIKDVSILYNRWFVI
ncbi:ABC transporter transmembrane domain-containing protein, partial [Lutibacter sp.]|uniref:ABC transporter transmembrane domain-containing protein n=1 Tax=Lutibacter sp. TaxID=1925666 RepID=UPI0025BA3E55